MYFAKSVASEPYEYNNKFNKQIKKMLKQPEYKDLSGINEDFVKVYVLDKYWISAEKFMIGLSVGFGYDWFEQQYNQMKMKEQI